MTLKRIDTLDTIRGIASAQVLFYHCFLTIPSIWTVYLNKNAHVNSFAKWLTYSPLHVLWGGHEAVILFFVLSGFVLYLPFLADRPLNYPSYFIKRFFRLYAPFAVTLIIAGIIRKMVVNSLPPHEFSAWFLDMWSKPLAPGEYFNFFLSRAGIITLLLRFGVCQ